MAENKKRPASTDARSGADKKQKTKKQWQVPRKNIPPAASHIEPGDAGIWATCDMNKEAKCVGELRDLFNEYAERLYGSELKKNDYDDNQDVDIEAEINAEVEEMQKPAEKPLFQNVRIDVQCVLFFKTRPPVVPTDFVQYICDDAASTLKKRTRFAKRLTPMTLMGKATEAGLDALAKEVLAPVFGGEGNVGKTFAIRPTVRNHGKILTRDVIIKNVAELVGKGHKVNLDNPEFNIVVEVYRNICGMSVVGADYDKLKRFNIAEICQPSSQAGGEGKGPPGDVAEPNEPRESEGKDPPVAVAEGGPSGEGESAGS